MQLTTNDHFFEIFYYKWKVYGVTGIIQIQDSLNNKQKLNNNNEDDEAPAR